MERTWPDLTSFAHDDSDMLRAFFHLAGQVQRSSQDEIRVRAANLHFAVESAEIYLCRGQSLLPHQQFLTQFAELWNLLPSECLMS